METFATDWHSQCCCLVIQTCLTLWDPIDCSSPPGSSVHRILQARILEWAGISFSNSQGRWPFNTRLSEIKWKVNLSNNVPLKSWDGEGNGNPLQYSCLENSMDRGVWQATAHRVKKSWTWLNDWALQELEVMISLFLIIILLLFSG